MNMDIYLQIACKEAREKAHLRMWIPPCALLGLSCVHFSLSRFMAKSEDIRLFGCIIFPVSLMASGRGAAPVGQCSKLLELNEDEQLIGTLLSPMGNTARQWFWLLHREESEAEASSWTSDTSVFPSRLQRRDDACGTPVGTMWWESWGWKGPASQAPDTSAWPFSSHRDRAASTAAASKASAASSAWRRREMTQHHRIFEVLCFLPCPQISAVMSRSKLPGLVTKMKICRLYNYFCEYITRLPFAPCLQWWQ